MSDKDVEGQLKHFFREDPQYLKRYVQEHPENQMAWYLLGREYEAQGKQGKALYCYSQAGDIYEAFENQKMILPNEQTEHLQAWKESLREKRRRSFRRKTVSVLGILMLLLSFLYMPERSSKPAMDVREAAAPPGDASGAAGDAQAAAVFYYFGDKSKQAVSPAITELLVRDSLSRLAILVRGIPFGQGGWVGWREASEPLLTVETGVKASERQVTYLDADSCECEPADGRQARYTYDAWAVQQEQRLVLHSALTAYIRRNEEPPANLSDLSRPYPDNMLPGVTPYMKELYERQKEQLDAEAKAAAADAGKRGDTPDEGGGNAAGEASVIAEPLAEPLEIVVDRQNYRLAVVSGRVIVRSYSVGLGGERTPEGEFVISEKVRNPNGKSNGEFGSRGMTLSDTLYAIHGTNRPRSIGKDESLGCIRMLKEDVEELFDMVPLGTKVTIGTGLLPDPGEGDGKERQERFSLPLFTEETNPHKVYRWLD